MAIVKNFNEFDPTKGTALKEKEKEQEVQGMGNQDANARKAIANLANAELEIQKKVRERIKLAKDWAAASDEERPDLLDQLKKLTKEIKSLQLLVARAEDEFNVASGVEVLEKTEEPVKEEPNEEMAEEMNAAVNNQEQEEKEEEEEPVTAIQEAPQVATVIKEVPVATPIQESDDYLIFKRK